MRIEFHPAAGRELTDSVEYYDSRLPGLGADFLGEFRRSLDLIDKKPRNWCRRRSTVPAGCSEPVPILRCLPAQGTDAADRGRGPSVQKAGILERPRVATTMNKAKRKQLAQRGWKVGGAAEFLGLSAEESCFIELKLAFSRRLRERREALKLTQSDLAQRLQSSQSRIAKMEAGDPSVSLDLLIRSLFALGATRRDLARAIAASKPPREGHAKAA